MSKRQNKHERMRTAVGTAFLVNLLSFIRREDWIAKRANVKSATVLRGATGRSCRAND
jgi:hypothetical protein